LGASPLKIAGAKTIWVTGAGGLIGNLFAKSLPSFAPDWRVFPLSRAELDITDYKSVKRLFELKRPDMVIHCAAMSKSPACQSDPALARKVNVEATKVLCGIASAIPFIFFSTDLVFDGRKGDYLEADSPNPLSVYGETKVEAERIVLENSGHTVIRTSLNAGASPTGGRSFNEEIKMAWEQGRTLNLFVDEYRSPIHAAETTRAVWEIAARGGTGIFHVAGTERLSRFEIGQLLARRWAHLNPKINPTSLKTYQGAQRPPDTSLNCDKVRSLLGFPLPGFSEWMGRNQTAEF
jgi:dTDP-4-dehydrorhamnose reductase